MAITVNGTANTIAGLAVGGLPDGTVDTDMLATNAITSSLMPAGAILQVLQSTRTDMISTTSATFVDVLTQAITPSSTSNKILIFFQGMECQDGGDGNTYSRYKLMRDSTSIYNGDDGSHNGGASSGRFGRQEELDQLAGHARLV